MAKYEPNSRGICPHCRTTVNFENLKSEVVVWPQSSGRAPIPPEVPAHIVSDYNEAALIFGLSPKAKDLSKQIDEVLPKLPGHIAESIDAVRNIGNFAALNLKLKEAGKPPMK